MILSHIKNEYSALGFPKENYADGRYVPKRSRVIKNKKRKARK